LLTRSREDSARRLSSAQSIAVTLMEVRAKGNGVVFVFVVVVVPDDGDPTLPGWLNLCRRVGAVVRVWWRRHRERRPPARKSVKGLGSWKPITSTQKGSGIDRGGGGGECDEDCDEECDEDCDEECSETQIRLMRSS